MGSEAMKRAPPWAYSSRAARWLYLPLAGHGAVPPVARLGHGHRSQWHVVGCTWQMDCGHRDGHRDAHRVTAVRAKYTQ